MCIRDSKNTGKKGLVGNVWTYCSLHGTQRFVYNKEIWYDCGFPASLTESVMTARVPYSDIVQIKRLSSQLTNMKAVDASCDYQTFIGDTAASAFLPKAVVDGAMQKGGAGRKINRFATAAIAANQFGVSLNANQTASVVQKLLFVTDKKICDTFRAEAGHTIPTYKAMETAFAKATKTLLRATTEKEGSRAAQKSEKKWPNFEVVLPSEKAVSEYANSVWTGVKELYENCRAHGAKLADGIELGTRDRGQDMWPKLKEDPARVRADLAYVLSFMYVTHEGAFPKNRKLTLREKLHGMFPRQYPSQWNDRSREVKNDNRPYTDSPLWLVNSLNMYLRETGDISLLFENVATINLTDPDHPETSGIVGCDLRLPLVKVIEELLNCFERHADDSPYGMAQILYGDWCDPIDMFGCGKVGDAKTRGMGRGVQTRLSAHLFLSLIETIDTLESPMIAEQLKERKIRVNVEHLKAFASRLRQNIVKWAWEDGTDAFMAGFLNCIHELRLDGTVPNYAKGETGYTLGSLTGRDFDGINRRELGGQAFCLGMLTTTRTWLVPIPETERIVKKLLRTVDKLFYDKKLGLTMYTKPIANNQRSIELCGRMGVLPVGTAENGEYHHCQVFMHFYRLGLATEATTVLSQFKPMMSALRDASLCGPFETPCTSYVSDKDDPHFGKGMYFGLSGSVDWIVEIFHKFAGVEFALHDSVAPAIRIAPRLPESLGGSMVFRRIIHFATGKGAYRQIPFELKLRTEGKGSRITGTQVFVNGQKQDAPEIQKLHGLDRIQMEIVTFKGK